MMVQTGLKSLANRFAVFCERRLQHTQRLLADFPSDSRAPLWSIRARVLRFLISRYGSSVSLSWPPKVVPPRTTYVSGLPEKSRPPRRGADFRIPLERLGDVRDRHEPRPRISRFGWLRPRRWSMLIGVPQDPTLQSAPGAKNAANVQNTSRAGHVQNNSTTATVQGPASQSGEFDRPAAGQLPSDWLQWLHRRQEQVNRAILDHLNGQKSPNSRLLDAVSYSMTNGGKRLRPILVLESCAVCGGTDDAAISAAVAIECVHAFSLVHDDLPAMDDDDLRRGKPTTHKQYGDAMAILAGDWLLAHASELVARSSNHRPVAAQLVTTLASATAAMIVGQAADIDGEGISPTAESVCFIHEKKTAALFEAACRMGAVCAEAAQEDVERMGRFGRGLGMAFQIADDLLDCNGSEVAAGKRVGKDAFGMKQTYPAVFGVAESRESARRELEVAVAELDNFGPAAQHLRGLAQFVVSRDR